jgi:hypothetical protein
MKRSLRRSLRRTAAAVTLAGLPVLAFGCNPKPVGELLLVVQTDLSLPKDIDTIRIEVSNGGSLQFRGDYDRLGSPDGQIHLPATLGLLAPSNPSDPIEIIVSGFVGGSDGQVVLEREAVTTCPTDRVAVLDLRIDFLCLDQATEMGGEAASSCPSGKTCVAGSCASTAVSATSLTTYTADQVDAKGGCFDGVACWTNPTVADVDRKTCTLPPVSGVNIALQTQGAGICGPIGCFVTLDADDPEGWTVGAGGRIVLPPAVCTQIGTGQVVNVVTEPISAACGAKKLSLPTCGAWSGAPLNPAPYVGPLALSGGQARPAALALLAGKLFWTDIGVAGATGALKSVSPAGGTPASIGAMSHAPRALVPAGTSAVFWTDAPGTPGGGSIFRAAGSTVTQPITGLNAPEGISFALVAGTGKLFWSDFQDGTISVADDDGGDVAQLATGQSYPYRVAADAHYVYWTNEGTLGSADGSVARYEHTAATGKVEVLAMQQSTPRAIVLDVDPSTGEAVAVYWATFAPAPGGAIQRRHISGSTPGAAVTIASGLDYPNGIALDADNVYWSNRGSGTIVSLAKTAGAGTAPTTLVADQRAPGSLTTDGTNVYWVNEGSSSVQSGAIIKLAKGQ